MNAFRAQWAVGCTILACLAGCRNQPNTHVNVNTDEGAPRGSNAPTQRPGALTTTTPSSADISVSAPIVRNDQPAPAASSNTGSSNAASSDTASPAYDAAINPSLLDHAGNPLPQTEDQPSASSPALSRRMNGLVEAIAKDDPALALPGFFPVEAYAQVKAIAKPERDWKRRLVAAFERNIHEYHRKLGAAAAGIRWARLEVPEAKVKWMKPGSEGNRVGYFRVLRSKLVVAKADGTEVDLEVTSMISWRGEWYVVHLHGFE